MPTLEDVLDAFDSMESLSVQSMALQLALEKRGFAADDAVNAINSAISATHLMMDPRTHAIRKI